MTFATRTAAIAAKTPIGTWKPTPVCHAQQRYFQSGGGARDNTGDTVLTTHSLDFGWDTWGPRLFVGNKLLAMAVGNWDISACSADPRRSAPQIPAISMSLRRSRPRPTISIPPMQ